MQVEFSKKRQPACWSRLLLSSVSLNILVCCCSFLYSFFLHLVVSFTLDLKKVYINRETLKYIEEMLKELIKGHTMTRSLLQALSKEGQLM